MVRPEIIRKRLNKLDEYLAILDNARRYSWYEILQNRLHDLKQVRDVFVQFL